MIFIYYYITVTVFGYKTGDSVLNLLISITFMSVGYTLGLRPK